MSAVPDAPLSGLRVLDLATFLSASFAATLLADFGADVVKLELPGRGDPQRGLGRARVPGHADATTWWATVGRNKRSMVLDLRVPQARPVFEALVREADVVVENFRPGTMERWGVGADWMHEVNPDLVLLRVSGFGQSGPYSNRASFERAAQAFSGLMYITGEPDRPPQRVGLPVCDYTSGVWGALGVLLCLVDGLRARESGGARPGGQVVDHPIYASFLPMLRDLASVYDVTGEIGERSGNRSSESAPGEAYLTSDEKWVFIAVTGDRVFGKAMHAIGRAELATDPRFADGVGRLRHRAVLDQTMTDWVAARPMAQVLSVLSVAGVPASPVNSIADLLADEHSVARQDFVRMPYDESDVLMPAPLPRLSRTPGSLRRRAPGVGEHTDELLREARVPAADVSAARAAGAFDPPDPPSSSR